MLSSAESVRQVVEEIAAWLVVTPNPGEAVVRQVIVLRLLYVCGFDIWNPRTVIPEETDRAGFRPDLRVLAGENEFVLELKGMNVGLHEKDYTQVASYAGLKGIRWAMLTDGRVWVVVDEHLKGPYLEQEVLKVELNQNAISSFVDDITLLLSEARWRAGKFEESVRLITAQQKQRQNVARVLKERRPTVEGVQKEFGIDTFENAAAAAVKMGLITEAEQSILLGVDVKAYVKSKEPTTKLKKNSVQQKNAEEPSILFTYQTAGVKAQALYYPQTGVWLIKSGSTAVGEIKAYAMGVLNRRQQLLEQGVLETTRSEHLRFVKDVEYSSPSSAAGDVSGASKNGWDVWIDELGRPAQFHRPQRS